MTADRPLRVAIVGAGPAGLYAASYLLEGPGGTYVDGDLRRLADRPVEVDVLDRLPTPWGLVRHGVAPDHPEKKLVQTVFEAVAARPGFRFYGNVEVGRDVLPRELSTWYDAVIYAVGAAGDTHMGIPGEELPGCYSAREFVAWYNGHPDHSDLDIVTGWIKQRPRGIIGTNKKCARDTVRSLLADADSGSLPTDGTLDAATLDALLQERQPRLVDQPAWQRIDDDERRPGRATGRPRRELTTYPELLHAAQSR